MHGKGAQPQFEAQEKGLLRWLCICVSLAYPCSENFGCELRRNVHSCRGERGEQAYKSHCTRVSKSFSPWPSRSHEKGGKKDEKSHVKERHFPNPPNRFEICGSGVRHQDGAGFFGPSSRVRRDSAECSTVWRILRRLDWGS